MAVAAPARRSRAATAPAPSRTTPPKRKAPARKPTRARATAPAKAPVRRAPAKAPARRAAATAPARRTAPRRAVPAGRPKLAVVAGRTAVAVSQLPDSSLVVRMTRGRAWIAVLGILLVGIVGLNVATLSFAASSGKIDAQITALEKENTMLESRVAERYSTARVRSEAAALGLAMPTTEEPKLVEPQPGDVATAAARLAAAGG
ncbi:MAG TPA: hypothetical protein VFI17_13015 [Solirubrobacterales bacterium]|nr:hypothetical protein [Solirubrobacterales bacterium]